MPDPETKLAELIRKHSDGCGVVAFHDAEGIVLVALRLTDAGGLVSQAVTMLPACGEGVDVEHLGRGILRALRSDKDGAN